MKRILIAGYQHETNSFAPSLAGWQEFEAGNTFPPYTRGPAMLQTMEHCGMPVAGFIQTARRLGWALLPSVWAGAAPSSFVTRDAFERIAREICEDVRQALFQGLDAIYLDLHGAAMAEHVPDSEGELLARIRGCVGPDLPIVASVDLHANVTEQMLSLADGLMAYRTYPHVDMLDTGQRAADLLARRFDAGVKAHLYGRRLPFLIPLNSQSTLAHPAGEHYQRMALLEAGKSDAVLNFCMGFPAADFAGCAPMVWGYGTHAMEAVDALYDAVCVPEQWALNVLDASHAVERALALAEVSTNPVLIADTQDNPGAGGNGNTTGLLHELLKQGAGQLFPGKVALGMLTDSNAAQAARQAGPGAVLRLALGQSVNTFSGVFSDEPVLGDYTVVQTCNGECTLEGAMMQGVHLRLGPSACLDIDGIRVAVVSEKTQLIDRQILRMVGIDSEQMRIIILKSSNHFRADFMPIASHVLVAKAAGPMAADPGDLPWRQLSPEVRPRP